MDTVDLQEELLTRVPMLKSCPHWLRGRFREGLTVALRERHRPKLANDELGQIRAWKLFCLVPKMLLHRPRNTGSVGRDELARRVTEFQQGHWVQLMREANEFQFQSRPASTRTPEEETSRRALAAQSRVQRGQVSRARQELTGAALAPRNATTLEALQGRRPQDPVSAIPREVLDFQPASPLQLDSKAFAKCLREAPAGCSPGPGGMHQRDASGLSGRSRVVPVVVLCQRRLRQRNSSAHGGPSVNGGHHDSVAKTRRRGERNRNWDGFQEACGQVFSTTIWQDSGNSVFPIPVRLVHKSGDRLRGPRHQSVD